MVYHICRLHTANPRLQTADRRLHTLQIVDCKLNDTHDRNYPNKVGIVKKYYLVSSKVDITVQNCFGLISKMLVAVLH